MDLLVPFVGQESFDVKPAAVLTPYCAAAAAVVAAVPVFCVSGVAK